MREHALRAWKLVDERGSSWSRQRVVRQKGRAVRLLPASRWALRSLPCECGRSRVRGARGSPPLVCGTVALSEARRSPGRDSCVYMCAGCALPSCGIASRSTGRATVTRLSLAVTLRRDETDATASDRGTGLRSDSCECDVGVRPEARRRALGSAGQRTNQCRLKAADA